jgi:ABC-type multidrug transport system fused ATPase/permease subunit
LAQPLEIYKNKIKHFQSDLQKLEEQSRFISNLRLAISLGGIGIGIYLYAGGQNFGAYGVFIVTSLFFAVLVSRHQSLRKQKAYSEAMLKINKESEARFSDAWTLFPDTGSEFIEESHPYAVDLDIFGKRSLFQLVNTTSTFLGREKLKNLLLSPSLNQSDVMRRQEIIKELAEHLDFRQNLQAEGSQFSKTIENPEELFRWVVNFSKRPWTSPLIKILIRLSPLVLILLIAFSFLLPGVIPYFIPLIWVLCHALLIFYFNKSTSFAFSVANRYQKNIKSYKGMLRVFEKENFNAPELKKLQALLKNRDNQTAFRQIRRLEKTVDMTYIRYHQLYLIFNFITLWDLHVMVALEGWKKECGIGLKRWLHILGEIEALSSLAHLHHDHPDWCFPTFNINLFRIAAKDLGHPLLPDNRVTNDLEMSQKGEILLITGSNMSGKSTFLRTVGINLVLAYLGAPVCAHDFQCPFLNIYTSMRINDNLDTGTSSFFAELVRIKAILEESKKGKPIFFLLDEIFRGTNSRDRHTGAKHLIRKLSSTGAMGLVSTHDLELGDLAKESTYIKNFHFNEYYQNGQIYFDYKLKPGVSTTRNAIFLMKMAGIDIND